MTYSRETHGISNAIKLLLIEMLDTYNEMEYVNMEN